MAGWLSFNYKRTFLSYTPLSLQRKGAARKFRWKILSKISVIETHCSGISYTYIFIIHFFIHYALQFDQNLFLAYFISIYKSLIFENADSISLLSDRTTVRSLII